MTYSFEVDPNLETIVEVEGVEFYTDYEGSCDEEGFKALGIDPNVSTDAKPGSEEKVLMLAARYAAGLPLWHDKDCYDHAPSGLFGDEDDDFDEDD